MKSPIVAASRLAATGAVLAATCRASSASSGAVKTHRFDLCEFVQAFDAVFTADS
jgi:hypothetical protein